MVNLINPSISLNFLFFQTSLFGSICNVYLLVKFLLRDGKSNGFQRICLVKTVPNIIVCFSFLFWAIPLTAFLVHYDEVSYSLNNIMGFVAGTWSYMLSEASLEFSLRCVISAPMLQVCMACNRFYVLYFPFGIKTIKKVPMTTIMILVAVFVSGVISAFNLPGKQIKYWWFELLLDFSGMWLCLRSRILPMATRIQRVCGVSCELDALHHIWAGSYFQLLQLRDRCTSSDE